MKIKQREANRMAMAMAAALVRYSDLDSLFGELTDQAETDAERQYNERVLTRAQAHVADRLQRLAAP